MQEYEELDGFGVISQEHFLIKNATPIAKINKRKIDFETIIEKIDSAKEVVLMKLVSLESFSASTIMII